MSLTLAYEETPAPRRASTGPTLAFDAAARVAEPRDNCAIATSDLAQGTTLQLPSGTSLTLSVGVLEGHRFALVPIAAGALLLSWGEPFGKALRTIAPGEWVCNAKALHELRKRGVRSALDVHSNFVDFTKQPSLTPDGFAPGVRHPLRPHLAPGFDGFVRSAGRGVGTRNYMVLLCATSRANAFARALERRLRSEPKTAGFDGVVALPHTEDGAVGDRESNNRPLLIRTLTGWLLHPNVGACVVLQTVSDQVAADNGAGISYDTLRAHAIESGRAGQLEALPHAVRTLPLRDFEGELEAAEAAARVLLPEVASCARVRCPPSALQVAQQCGGSDAFSGTNANPLVGEACRLLVEAGGTALLAETDELIGAEQYVLQNVKDYATAERFLAFVARFQRHAAAHNCSAEGNPSGGNMYRGLYNIALKSLGAAMKRHPDVRLEHVLEYAEPLPPAVPVADAEVEGGGGGGGGEGGGGGGSGGSGGGGGHARGAGYCFMDSPGNDLESIAGQVAAGCNVVYFTTGNGSITNFPFVPTIKVVSTAKRYALMANDMDVNAGEEGTRLQLGVKLLELTLAVASGQRTKGEAMGHHQVQIWRNWAHHPVAEGDSRIGKDGSTELAIQAEAARATAQAKTPQPYPVGANPLGAVAADAESAAAAENALRLCEVPASVQGLTPSYQSLPAAAAASAAAAAAAAASADQVGGTAPPTTEYVALVLPTSLCSSEVARNLAADLSTKSTLRVVSLPHTEGCGVSDERPAARTLLGHLASPLVKHALLLEHGCEKTHNDYFAEQLAALGLGGSEQYGWASLQKDGGVGAVETKVRAWFEQQVVGAPAAPPRVAAPLAQLRLGLMASHPGDADGAPVPEALAVCFGQLVHLMAQGGGQAMLPVASPLLSEATFLETTLAWGEKPRATTRYGERGLGAGLHVMEAHDASGKQPMSWVETTVGLCGAGLHAVVAWRPASCGAVTGHPMVPVVSVQLDDADVAADVLLPAARPHEWLQLIVGVLAAVAGGELVPIALRTGNVDFQIPRGGAVSL